MQKEIKTFCIAGHDGAIVRMVNGLFNWEPAEVANCDVLFLPGGADINPALYGEPGLKDTHWYPSRDEFEIDHHNVAVHRNIPLIGICRGAQLIHALHGGKLWQDVDNHVCRPHPTLDLASGNTFNTTSCHHQMMRVDNFQDKTVKYRVVAVAERSTERHAFGSSMHIKTGAFRDDIEVLWYPELKALCYQGHPEYRERSCMTYFTLLLQRFGFISRDTMREALRKIHPQPMKERENLIDATVDVA